MNRRTNIHELSMGIGISIKSDKWFYDFTLLHARKLISQFMICTNITFRALADSDRCARCSSNENKRSVCRLSTVSENRQTLTTMLKSESNYNIRFIYYGIFDWNLAGQCCNVDSYQRRNLLVAGKCERDRNELNECGREVNLIEREKMRPEWI